MVLTAGTFYTSMVFAPTGNYDTTTMQLADDLNMQKGSHQFGFGGNWIHPIRKHTVNPNSGANFTFTGTYTGTALADFLTGQMASFSEGNPALLYTRQQYIGLYAQDTWRADSRLWSVMAFAGNHTYRSMRRMIGSFNSASRLFCKTCTALCTLTRPPA